jgi:flavin-dependent dehydrogenase
LSRAVRQADSPDEQAFCLEAEVPLRRPDPFADAEDLIHLYFTPDGRGYGWVFHHGSYYSVGIGAVGPGFRSPMAAFREFAAARGFDAAAIKPAGHFVPCGGLPRVVAADRLLLAGDAAGFVDPFYGEGLAYAIRSGQLAAETLLEAASENDLSAGRLAAYAAKCQAAFGENLGESLKLARTMRRWPSAFFGLLASDPAVLGKYLHIPAMRLSYREFTRWLLVRAPLFWLKGLARPRYCDV